MHSIGEIVEEIYSGRAHARYGLTSINQLQHALQSAAIAEKQGESPALIVAALLHDVGHMIHDLGENPAAEGVDDGHEARGAAWLEPYFGADVVEPIRLHVAAKRYLCAAESDYFSKLSADSTLSLKLQGGPMSREEMAAFETLEFAKASVCLRRIDELAKDKDAVTPPLEHFLGYVRQVERKNEGKAASLA